MSVPTEYTLTRPSQYRLNVWPALSASVVGVVKAARVFSGIEKHWALNPKVGLVLGKWSKQWPNIKLALRQHVS